MLCPFDHSVKTREVRYQVKNVPHAFWMKMGEIFCFHTYYGNSPVLVHEASVPKSVPH